MGSSIAYHLSLRCDSSTNIHVIERDPSYTRASACLSAGGVRQQFSHPVNIQLGMMGSDFLHNITQLQVEGKDKPDAQFNQGGYLFLASGAGKETLIQNHRTQQ